MPLWFHPPPVPVDLGAPIYPSPLLYHPPPYLVDPRPCHPYDNVYCACQFSHSSGSTTFQSAARQPPPAHETAFASAHTRRKLAALKKFRETEWEYEQPRDRKKLAIDAEIQRASIPRTTTVNINIQNGCHHLPRYSHLDYSETIPTGTGKTRVSPDRVGKIQRAIPNPEHGGNANRKNMLSIGHIRAEIAAEIAAQRAFEKEREDKIRQEIRTEIEEELRRKNFTMRLEMSKREMDIERRLEAIKEKEKCWVQGYGLGIVNGSGSANFPRQEISTPADDILAEFKIVESQKPTEILSLSPIFLGNTATVSHRSPTPTSSPIEGKPPLPNQTIPSARNFTPMGKFASLEGLRQAPSEDDDVRIPHLWSMGSYVTERVLGLPNYQRPFGSRPPPPTVYTLSTTSGSECSFGQKYEHDPRRDPAEDTTSGNESFKSVLDDNPGVDWGDPSQPKQDPTTSKPAPLASESYYSHNNYVPSYYQHDVPDLPRAVERVQKIEPQHIEKLRGHGSDIVITITRSYTGSSASGSHNNSDSTTSAPESIVNSLRESLHKIAAEFEPREKKVHWDLSESEGSASNAAVLGIDCGSPTGNVNMRMQPREREYGIVEPPLRRRC